MGTFNNNILPTSGGLDLGSSNQQWDAYIQNLVVSGTFSFPTGIQDVYPVDQLATSGAGTSGSPWVGWESAVNALASGSVAYFRAGHYSTSTGIVPANTISINGCGWDTVINYTGSGYAYDVVTKANSSISNLKLTITTNCLAAARYQHVTSANNANNQMFRVQIVSSTWTSGQVGVLLYSTSLTDANYLNKIEVTTLDVDVPVKFLSAVSTNSANANHIWLNSNGHTVAVKCLDGTDNVIEGLILGCKGFTGGTAVQMGGSGGGGRGASNNIITNLLSEQGGSSTCLSYQSGALINTAFVMSNDTTNVSDTSGVTTNRSFVGGVMYNPMIAGNNLNFGGVSTAATLMFKRSSTDMEVRLGDDSGYGTLTASRVGAAINTGTAPLVIFSTTPVANLTVQRLDTPTIVNPVVSYNGIATVSNGVPAEYATVDLTAQGAAITTTTLYAVPSTGAGQYRLAWNAQVEVVDGSSSTLGALTIVYTSPDAVVHTITAGALTSAGAVATTSTTNTTAAILTGLPLILNCKASTNITYAMAYVSNTPGSMKFNLHLKLEAL